MKITQLRPTLESDGLLSKQNKLKKWIGFNTPKNKKMKHQDTIVSSVHSSSFSNLYAFVSYYQLVF